jgi:hypothetical protein
MWQCLISLIKRMAVIHYNQIPGTKCICMQVCRLLLNKQILYSLLLYSIPHTFSCLHNVTNMLWQDTISITSNKKNKVLSWISQMLPWQRMHCLELKTIPPHRGSDDLQIDVWPTLIGPRTAENNPTPPSIENESWILSGNPCQPGRGVVMFEIRSPTVVCTAEVVISANLQLLGPGMPGGSEGRI